MATRLWRVKEGGSAKITFIIKPEAGLFLTRLYLTLDESVAGATEDRALRVGPATDSPAVHLVMLLVLGVVHGVSAFSG